MSCLLKKLTLKDFSMILCTILILSILVSLVVYQILNIINNILNSLKEISATDEIENIKNLILFNKILFDLIIQIKGIEKQLKFFMSDNVFFQKISNDLKIENKSIEQNFQELERKSFILESEYKEAVELTIKIRRENDTFAQRIKFLEANQKALVEELGGAIGKEDLEYATWDLMIQSIKLLIKERDKAVKDNQTIKQEKYHLTKSIKVLEYELALKANEIKSVKQSLIDINANKNQLKSKDNNSIQQLKTHLARKELNIKDLEIQNQTKDTCIKKLEKDCWEKESILKAFIKEKDITEAKLKNIERIIIEKELNLKVIKEQNLELINREKRLENEIKNSSLKVSNTNDGKLAQALSKVESQLQEKEIQNNQLSAENSRLTAIIKELMSNRKEILPKRDIPNYSLEKLNIELIDPDIYLNLSLVDEYSELIDFVQSYFPNLELTTIEELVNSKHFYEYLISRLYLINWLLIYKVRDLEKLTIRDIELSDTLERNNYEGKALYWCNQELMTELNILLSKTYFLNDQIFSISYFM
ncbi:hypothetical protein ACWATR_32360 [Nostoc sp. UIC 10890]